MGDFAKFLSINGIKRKDIAAFLGVSGAFISQITSGDRPLPEDKLAMIKANAYGWDTSMLTPNKSSLTLLTGLRPKAQISTDAKIRRAIQEVFDPEEQFHIGYLERKVIDLESEISQKEALIHQLYKEIGILEHKLELSRKGEIAGPAVGSSDASAV